MIGEAEALLSRAAKMSSIGRYQLEAAVQSAHAARRNGGPTDWCAILTLYDALLAMTGSPVVAINRAVALAEVEGTEVGLAVLDALSDETKLSDYQPFWAARAELLSRIGRTADADLAYERAIGLESDPAVRQFLQNIRERLC